MRAFALLIALMTGAALLLRLGLTMSEGARLLEAAWINARFFTILTNLLVALTMACIAFGACPGAAWMTGLALWIGFVGVVYHLLLAALWEPEGLVWVADQLVHTATPLATFLFWLIHVRKSQLRWPAILLWMAWPLLYAGYAILRGQSDGIYPYPFLDVGALGMAQVALNAAGFAAAFGGVGLCVLLGARLGRRRP